MNCVHEWQVMAIPVLCELQGLHTDTALYCVTMMPHGTCIVKMTRLMLCRSPHLWRKWSVEHHLNTPVCPRSHLGCCSNVPGILLEMPSRSRNWWAVSFCLFLCLHCEIHPVRQGETERLVYTTLWMCFAQCPELLCCPGSCITFIKDKFLWTFNFVLFFTHGGSFCVIFFSVFFSLVIFHVTLLKLCASSWGQE